MVWYEHVKINLGTAELELDDGAQHIRYEPSALNSICFIHRERRMGKHNGQVTVTQSVSRVSTRAQLWRRTFLLQGRLVCSNQPLMAFLPHCEKQG